jgi:hypothetical protein
MAYGDVNDAQKKYLLYTSEDPTILETREDEFMKKGIEAILERNQENFKNVTTKYKTYTNLDKWKINVFKRILDNLEVKVNPEDFLGDTKENKEKDIKQVNEDDPDNFI